MRSLSSVLKEYDMRTIFTKLCAECSWTVTERRLKRYYSIYCALAELWTPDYTPKVFLSDYRREGMTSAIPEYAFYGVTNPKDLTKDQKIDWRSVLCGDVELLIPDCVMELGEELLVAEIFYRIEMIIGDALAERTAPILFAHVACSAQEEENLMPAYRMLLENKLHFIMNKDLLKAECTEYGEKEFLLFSWGELFELANNFSIPYCGLDTLDPPNYGRALYCWSGIKNKYYYLSLNDYRENCQDGWQIIIEMNSYKSVPLVYVRNRFGQGRLLKDFELEEIVCMDIKVLNPRTVNANRIVAVLMFYLEYPIRAERIIKQQMIERLLRLMAARTKEAEVVSEPVRNIGRLFARRRD